MAENETSETNEQETQLSAIKRFLSKNTPGMKCARTIFQGVIGVVVANADIIVGAYVFDAAQRAVIVALVMAVLSPIMAALGEVGEQ